MGLISTVSKYRRLPPPEHPPRWNRYLSVNILVVIKTSSRGKEASSNDDTTSGASRIMHVPKIIMPRQNIRFSFFS